MIGRYTPDGSAGRPANDPISDRWGCRSTVPRPMPVGRPLGRPWPKPDSNAFWSVDRSVDRPKSHGLVHVLCTSVDRPLIWSTGRSTIRSPKTGFYRIENLTCKTLKILFKSHKIHKNKFIETH